MFHYKLDSKPNFDIKEKIIDNIFKIISHIINIPQKGSVNIVFVSKESIQDLNKKYRNINKATDVLSFHYYDDFSELGEQDIAGEIVLCEEKIVSQGKEYGLGTEKEFYKLLVHSILHLLGFDHEEDHDFKIMQEKEDLIWSELFEK